MSIFTLRFMPRMPEPLIKPLIAVSKKYLGAFTALPGNLAIERYQYVLVLIDDHGETLTQKALAGLLSLNKSYIVSIIDYLSEKGYVFREKNNTDRRKHLIRLTEKARHDLPLIKKAFNTINAQTFKGLSDDQIESFYNMLRIMEENLNDSNPSSIFFNIKRRPLI